MSRSLILGIVVFLISFLIIQSGHSRYERIHKPAIINFIDVSRETNATNARSIEKSPLSESQMELKSDLYRMTKITGLRARTGLNFAPTVSQRINEENTSVDSNVAPSIGVDYIKRTPYGFGWQAGFQYMFPREIGGSETYDLSVYTIDATLNYSINGDFYVGLGPNTNLGDFNRFDGYTGSDIDSRIDFGYQAILGYQNRESGVGVEASYQMLKVAGKLANFQGDQETEIKGATLNLTYLF